MCCLTFVGFGTKTSQRSIAIVETKENYIFDNIHQLIAPIESTRRKMLMSVKRGAAIFHPPWLCVQCVIIVCSGYVHRGVDQLGVFEAKIKRIKGLSSLYIWPLDFLLAPLCSSLLPRCDFLPQYLSPAGVSPCSRVKNSPRTMLL